MNLNFLEKKEDGGIQISWGFEKYFYIAFYWNMSYYCLPFNYII